MALLLITGGGPWGLGDALAAIWAVPILAAGILWGQQDRALSPGQWMVVGVPLLIVVLELMPLPASIWSSLPGRGSIAADLVAAGQPLSWRAVTLDYDGTMRAGMALLPAVAILIGLREFRCNDLRWLLLLWLLVAMGSVLLGMAQVGHAAANLRLHAFHNVSGALGLFANRNHQAAFLVASIPVCMAAPAWLAQGDVDLRHRFFAAACSAFLLLGVVLTGSRAGLVLGMLALTSSVPVWLGPNGRRTPGFASVWVARGAITLLVVGTAIAWHVVGGRDLLSVLQDSRWAIFHDVGVIGARYQPIGVGLGAFEQAFRPAPSNLRLEDAFVNHAHNDWLELWFELGWPFVVVAVFAVGSFVAMARRAWLAEPRADGLDALGKAAVIGLSTLGLHSLVDWPLRTGANMVVAAILLHLLWRLDGNSARPRQPRTLRGQEP